MENNVSGFYNDDGTRIDPGLVPKPGLCVVCKKNNTGGKEEILCTLTRNDQKDESHFECDVYEPMDQSKVT